MADTEQNLRDILRAMVREELRAAREDVSAPAPLGPDAEYIDDRKLAAWLDVSRATLQQMRSRAEGPPFVHVARKAVRYHVPTVGSGSRRRPAGVSRAGRAVAFRTPVSGVGATPVCSKRR